MRLGLLGVKGLRAVGKYYAERGAPIDHPATLAGMDRFRALSPGQGLAPVEQLRKATITVHGRSGGYRAVASGQPAACVHRHRWPSSIPMWLARRAR